MDYSLLLGIHDCDLADAGDDEDEVVGEDGRCDSNEESDPDSPQDGDLSTSPPDTPPANDDVRCRTLSLGSNEFEEKDPDDFIFSLQSSEGGKREIYFMGIIDVLTYYGAGKKAAHAAKTVKHGLSASKTWRRVSLTNNEGNWSANQHWAGAEISTVKPENYAKRFLEFIDKIVV